MCVCVLIFEYLQDYKMNVHSGEETGDSSSEGRKEEIKTTF